MLFLRLNATFGKLENQSLVLSRGLNLIHGPNEGGKSTWCAFLRTMLYGLSTRARGAAADKNRYAPWSGSTMQGVMDLERDGDAITVTRRTVRANSPMGAFSAVYTGTATAVEGLTGANCGNTLLQVPREVFERSAFIRQAGLAIDQDAELERRIAALITTGEEDTSYSQVYERLKKQLTARRLNRSVGQLPAIENEIAQVTEALTRARQLQETAAAAQGAIPALEEQEQQLEAQLARAQAAQQQLQAQQAQAETRQAYHQALHQLDEAKAQAQALADTCAALPPKEQLIALKAAASNIVVSQLSLRQLETQAAQRREETRAAQAALEPYVPFRGRDGQSAREQARQDAADWDKASRRGGQAKLHWIAAALLLLLAVSAALLLPSLAIPAALVLATAALANAVLAQSARRQGRQAQELARRYGGADFSAYAEAYDTLYKVYDQCRRQQEAVELRLETLRGDVATAQEKLLADVRAFAPLAEEPPALEAAINGALERYRQWEAAQRTCDGLRIKCETLEAALPVQAPVPAPAAGQTPQVIQAQLTRVRQELLDLRSRQAGSQGQLAALGEPADLEAKLEELQGRQARLQAEYDAIAMAMEALSAANTQLQNRFSPALGEKAANIFTKLTRGKYNKVLLSRELTATAQEADSAIPHEALSLSQGAADQLYLAVRLAICDLVLPPDTPLVLDDALTNFDDDRCAAALDFLMELSRQRQVLLFTCQEREGTYLSQRYPGQFAAVPL